MGLYSLFRAVFQAEYQDIISSGVIRNTPTGYETGKLFATTYDDATKFGNLLARWESNPDFKILEVDVPDNLKVTEFTADSMKAVAVDDADLGKLKIKGCS